MFTTTSQEMEPTVMSQRDDDPARVLMLEFLSEVGETGLKGSLWARQASDAIGQFAAWLDFYGHIPKHNLRLSTEEIGSICHFLSVASWIRIEQIEAVKAGEYPMDLVQGFRLDFALEEQRYLGPLVLKLNAYRAQKKIPTPEFLDKFTELLRKDAKQMTTGEDS